MVADCPPRPTPPHHSLRSRGEGSGAAWAKRVHWIRACRLSAQILRRLAGVRRRRVLLAQLEALDLSGRGFRQVGADLEPAGIFPQTRVLLDVVLQRLEKALVGLVSAFEHDEGLGFE